MGPNHRIFAGVAGGKKYFHGENDKLFDEAGVEQPPKLAAVLKAAFPPPPPQTTIPNPTQGRVPPAAPVITPINPSGPVTPPTTPPPPPQPKQPPPLPANDIPDDKPDQPPRSRGIIADITSHLGMELLRLAFPDLYNIGSRYRRILTKVERSRKKKRPAAKKPKATPAEKTAKKQKTAADKKRNDKELSLKIDATSSFVRTNGELLRQLLTAQTETITLLEKIANKPGSSGGSSISEGIIGAALFGYMRKLILPVLAAVGLGSVAALAYHEYNKDASKADDLTPKEPESDKPNAGNKSEFGDTNKQTKAMVEASKQKPSGKIVNIKADSINFEAKTIKLEATTLTINTTSISTSTSIGGATAPATQPNSTVTGGGDPTSGGFDPSTGQPIAKAPDAPGSVSPPAGPVFKPGIATPSSPGGSNPKAPGFGGISGGMGASEFGGKSYDYKAGGTAEAIRKNDITPTQSFQPIPKSSNERLSQVRAGFFEHMDKNPATKELVIKAALAEGGQKSLQANIEQMANYGAARGMKNFDQVLNSGFFGPINRGEAQQRVLSASDLEKADAALNAVRGGSNKIEYRIDQGSPGDTNYAREKNDPRYRGKVIDGAFFADHPDVGVGWAQKQMQADKEWKAQQNHLTTANAKNTQRMIGGQIGVGDLSTMFGKESITKMKALGGVHDAARSIDEKEDVKEEKKETEKLQQWQQPLVNETSKTGRGDYDIKPDLGPPSKVTPGRFTDTLRKQKLDSEGGWLWQHGPQGRNRAKQLSEDPWQSEPGYGPLDSTKPVPAEIPRYDESSTSSRPEQHSSALDDPPEKHEGSSTPITSHTDGPKKPKPIRPIDMDKYYPQYPKSDYNGQTVGIMVA